MIVRLIKQDRNAFKKQEEENKRKEEEERKNSILNQNLFEELKKVREELGGPFFSDEENIKYLRDIDRAKQ